LKDIPVGSDLLEVWAWDKHKDCGGVYEKIAVIRLQTKLYTSVAGDERLYFQHRRVHHDRKYWDRCTKKDIREDMVIVRTEDTIWEDGPRDVYDYWPNTDAAARDEYID